MPTPEISILSSARAAADQLSARERELRESHAAALKTYQLLANLPPPKDETIANMHAIVDRMAITFADKHGRSIVTAFGGALELQMTGDLKPRVPRLPVLNGDHDRLTLSDVCGLVPELVKARFGHIIQTAECETGSPIADRPEQLAKQAATIAAIESAHTELVDEAGSLNPPIVLRLLPVVFQRRESERLRAEREAIDRAARERMQADVERWATEQRGGAGHSQYLRDENAGRRQ